MNYFAHAVRFLDRPYFLAGTSLPDWLSVVKRTVRLRRTSLTEHLTSPDERTRQLVAGVVQHLEDDYRFHSAPAFSEVLVQVLRLVQPVVNTPGVSLVFLSHLMVEIMFDAALLCRFPNGANAYHAALAHVDPLWIEGTTQAIVGQDVEHLGTFVRLFCREKILHDYNDDTATLRRLNQVMARLKLPPLPTALANVLPDIRSIVAAKELDLWRALDG